MSKSCRSSRQCLEVVFKRELNYARPKVEVGDSTKRRAVDAVVADEEQRVIQEVEEVSPEFQVLRLSDPRSLDDREIPGCLRRTVELKSLLRTDRSGIRIEEDLAIEAGNVARYVWTNTSSGCRIDDL